MAQHYKVWQNAWRDCSAETVDIILPDSWFVTNYKMKADACKPLEREEIAARIKNPVHMPRIRDMAKNGKNAVIVFDDLSRGTPARIPAEIVLEELLSAGIRKENIRFLCALGNHGALTRADFVKKLGEDIVEKYPIYNHNPYEHLVKVGVDSFGQNIWVNREFMKCDIRIGIGSVSPHPLNGFGGGGKLIFPGLAGIETTYQNHSRREFAPFSTETCGLRKDIETMTDMVRPFFKIDAIINSRLEIVDLCAGDPIDEYYQAVEISEKLNTMKRSGEKKDVIFVNANAKYNEALIAVRIAAMDLKDGGDVVMINHCPQGQVVHYLYSAFGTDYGGRCWNSVDKRPVSKIGRIIYYTPYPDINSKMSLNEPDKVIFAKEWDEVMTLLKNHIPTAEVAIIPDGTICCFR
ncbi:MAG: lactate racemase domain-containing protein [Clostridiales bacterium]|nr:lactate racemase domain-containing protein [Clostridiales bacterium]